MAKRRVFISYHHGNEQSIVDRFAREFADLYDVFTDQSLERAANSTDVEYLNQVCREAIVGTSVTIVIVGTETGARKFVDWEIRYTLECRHGLMAILRPDLPEGSAWLPDRLLDNLATGYADYWRYPSSPTELSSMIEKAYIASSSLIDNSRPKRKYNG